MEQELNTEFETSKRLVSLRLAAITPPSALEEQLVNERPSSVRWEEPVREMAKTPPEPDEEEQEQLVNEVFERESEW